MHSSTIVSKLDKLQRTVNQRAYIKEEETIQLPKEKGSKGQTTIYKTLHN
jgi:hypothetical protein